MNEGLDPSMCSLQYVSIDDAVDLICKLGVGTLLVKMDLKDIYRIVPIYPDNQPFVAVEWEGQTYVDRPLPFGLRSAPKLFTAIADTIYTPYQGSTTHIALFG